MDFDYLVEAIKPTQSTILYIDSVGGLRVPIGATADRPTISAAGIIRWNTSTPGLEVYDGSVWNAMGTGTVTSIGITGTTGLTVNGSPVTSSGVIKLVLDANLQALSQLTTAGFVTRSAAGAYQTFSLASSTLTITNGDGVSGAPSIELAPVTNSGTASLLAIAVDTYGRVTTSSAASQANITTALGYTPINKAGDTSVGSLTFASTGNITLAGGTITGLPTSPSSSTEAVSKAYVDSVAQGLGVKTAVQVATTAAVTLSSLVVGYVLDGIVLGLGYRVLVKNQAAPEDNGIYAISALS